MLLASFNTPTIRLELSTGPQERVWFVEGWNPLKREGFCKVTGNLDEARTWFHALVAEFNEARR